MVNIPRCQDRPRDPDNFNDKADNRSTVPTAFFEPDGPLAKRIILLTARNRTARAPWTTSAFR